MRLFDLPPREQQHKAGATLIASRQRVVEGARTLTEEGTRTLTEAGTEPPSHCVGAAGNRNIFCYFVYETCVFEFEANYYWSRLGETEKQRGDKAEKAFHGIVAQ